MFNFNPQQNNINNFQQFANWIANSKQDPNALLDMLVKSGRVSQQQLQNAIEMAKTFQKLTGRK